MYQSDNYGRIYKTQRKTKKFSFNCFFHRIDLFWYSWNELILSVCVWFVCFLCKNSLFIPILIMMMNQSSTTTSSSPTTSAIMMMMIVETAQQQQQQQATSTTTSSSGCSGLPISLIPFDCNGNIPPFHLYECKCLISH